MGEGPSAILTPGSVALFSVVESVLLEGKLVQREAIRAKLASYQLARVLCTWPFIGDRQVLSGRPALALVLWDEKGDKILKQASPLLRGSAHDGPQFKPLPHVTLGDPSLLS